MTLIRAFQDRIVSASLISRWEIVNLPETPRSVYDDYIMRKARWIALTTFFISYLAIITLSTKIANTHFEFSMFCLVSIVIFCVFSLMFRQDKKCVKDCEKLKHFIIQSTKEPSEMSLEELVLQSSRTLVHLADCILKTEISLSKETKEEKRSVLENVYIEHKKSFKRAHMIFLKFSLVEKKLDSYFQTAKEAMRHSPENNSVVAPVST